jgi:hypothetical protein
MAFPPPLNISTVGGNTSIQDSLLQLYGNASSVVGQGSEEVYSHLHFIQDVSSNGGPSLKPFTFTFEIGTQNPCGWDPFLYSVVTGSGVPVANYTLKNTFNTAGGGTLTTTTLGPTFSGNCFNTNGATTILSFSILKYVNYASLDLAGIEVGMGVGST